jgi:hypothetical protein
MSRTAGDDVEVKVRVRRANLAALEEGVTLGVDLLTKRDITLQLEPHEDDVHTLAVVANSVAVASTPEPVNLERLP